jgi:hypothetical protein
MSDHSNRPESEPMRPEVVEESKEEEETDGPSVSQPTKLIRIASMTRAMLEEVREAQLDPAGRDTLMKIHRRSLEELRHILSPDLLEEFDEIFEPIRSTEPTDSVLRIAQAQLIGWLEGLFHGIQASLFSQQLAAQAQLAEMQQRRLTAPQKEESSGLYL